MSESLRALIISKGGLHHVSKVTGIARCVLQRWCAGKYQPRDPSRIEAIRRLPHAIVRDVGRPYRFVLCDANDTVLSRHQSAAGVVCRASRIPIYRRHDLTLYVREVGRDGMQIGGAVPLEKFKATLPWRT